MTKTASFWCFVFVGCYLVLVFTVVNRFRFFLKPLQRKNNNTQPRITNNFLFNNNDKTARKEKKRRDHFLFHKHESVCFRKAKHKTFLSENKRAAAQRRQLFVSETQKFRFRSQLFVSETQTNKKQLTTNN